MACIQIGGRLYTGYYCTAFPRFRTNVGMLISAIFPTDCEKGYHIKW